MATPPATDKPPQRKPSLLESIKNLWARILSPQTFFPVMIIALTFGVLLMFQFLPVMDFLQSMELKTYDLRMSMTHHEPSKDIVILAFDEDTFKINNQNYGSWPYKRDVFANCIKAINGAGAKLIAFDLMFIAEERGDEIPNKYFVDTFRDAKNTIVSMNFDNNLENSQALGIAISAEDIRQLKPYSVNLISKLNRNSLTLDLGEDGFFNNEYMTFNSFRKIMQPLYEVGERVAFINHAPDPDGMTRFNPLFFRFQYQTPLQTMHFPLHRNPQSGQLLDAEDQPVDKSGYLLDENGQYVLDVVNEFYPYLAFRAFLHSHFVLEGASHREPTLTLQPDGTLTFENYNIPLYKNGNYLVQWYNVNVFREKLQNDIDRLEAQRKDVENSTTMSDTRKRLELQQLENRLRRDRQTLSRPKESRPYEMVSAWRLMRAYDHQQKGTLDDQDRQVLAKFKDKYVFAGNTSPGGYDMKSTPVGVMPGVLVQATTFDNFHQNKGYMRYVSSPIQILVVLLLCALVSFITMRARSTLVMLGLPILLAIAYVALATWLFVFAQLWLNILIPLIVVFITTVIIFMTKYIQRTQAYQDAYAAANTDSMTGLYNHRFFKTHMANCMENSDRMNTKFSLVLIDIDHFKKFNDTYGHQAGDEVLRCVARKLKDTVRQADTVCRYGGEEMAVIVEKTGEEEALRVGQKVVSAIASEEYPISEGVTKAVTISAGVATYPTHGRTIEELIEFSDKGLYRAKENGRNQVGAQYDE